MNYSEETSRDALCLQAITVVSPSYFRILLAVECIVGILAIAPNALLAMTISKISIFPANLRLLMAHFSFILSWYATGDAVKTIYLLLAPVCGFNMSVFWCKIFDLACTAVPLPIMFYTLTALCAERLYACVRYKKYDKIAAQTPWLSRMLIVCSWACAVGIHGNPIFFLTSTEFVPICESNFVPLKSPSLYEIYIVLEVAASSMTAFVHCYTKYVSGNMAINRAKYSLSSRFQVLQNVRVNAVLVPSVALHVICHIPTFSLVIATRGGFEMMLGTKSILTRLIFLWRLIYALAHPILAFRYNPNLRQQMRQTVPASMFVRGPCVGTPSSAIQNRIRMDAPKDEIHFSYLHRQWEQTRGSTNQPAK